MPKTNELDEKVKKTTTKKTTAKKADSKKGGTQKKDVKKKETKKTTMAKKSVDKKALDKKVASKEPTAKKVGRPKGTTKKTADIENKKIKEVVVKRKNEKIEKQEKADEATIIEKIKNFLSKIIAMQEENVEEENPKSKEKKISSKKEKKSTPNYLLEYYDLPYRYNETVVKILAQTPKRLFVYWDISDSDREKYIKAFGDDFFYKTYPVLLLYNEDKKYMKEIPINDFANSWYIDIQDPKNKYIIQLGRKFKDVPNIVNVTAFEQEKIILRTDYLPFADSNSLEVPNDHVLLESLPRFLTFRNVKTNQETVKDLRCFRDIFGTTYSVKEFYKSEYKEELSEEGMFDMANPSSKLSSSSFK